MVQPDGLAEVGKSSGQIAIRMPGEPASVVRFGEPWIQRNCFIAVSNGSVCFASHQPCGPAVSVRFGKARIDFNGSGVIGYGAFQILAGSSHVAATVV